MVVDDDAIAEAVCRILSTAKTRQYVVTARNVMRVLGEEIHNGALRSVLRRYGFRYMRVGSYDLGKYVVDVEHARKICERLRRRKKRSLF